MKKLILYLSLFWSFHGTCQDVFYKVRNNIATGKSIDEIKTIDSCFTAGYFKDSALYYKTILNLKIGNNQSARKSLRILSKQYPQFSELHYLNGLVFFSNEKYGKCLEEFNLAAKATPKNIKVYYNRSVVLGLLQEYPSAIEDLNTCLAIDSAYVVAHYSRAFWHELTGNYAASAKDYEQTIKLDPKNYDAYVGLAYLCKTQNESTKACETINSAIKEGSQVAMELKEIFCK